jgi:hypothetical protein
MGHLSYVIPAKAGIHYEETQTPWAVVGSAVPLAFTRTRYERAVSVDHGPQRKVPDLTRVRQVDDVDGPRRSEGARASRRALSGSTPRGAVVVLRQPLGHAPLPRRGDGDGRPLQHSGLQRYTRAFPSIPSRHDVWRRVTCHWLAGMVVTGVVDSEEAAGMAREFAYGLANRAY